MIQTFQIRRQERVMQEHDEKDRQRPEIMDPVIKAGFSGRFFRLLCFFSQDEKIVGNSEDDKQHSGGNNAVPIAGPGYFTRIKIAGKGKFSIGRPIRISPPDGQLPFLQVGRREIQENRRQLRNRFCSNRRSPALGS